MSSSSPKDVSGQKVPAWKRLGLKLKPAASAEPSAGPAAGSQPNGAGKQDLGVNASAAAKRKRPDVSAHPAPDDSASPLKKTRFDNKTSKNTQSTPRLRKQKSVTFTDDTKNPADADTANGVKTPAKKQKLGKKAKKNAQHQSAAAAAALKPALEYLKTWKESRDSWKFNKNHQTLLIKRAFDPHAFPPDHIESFYEYIRDLKGHPRKRLRETARDIKKEDVKKGTAGFPEGTMDVQAKQAEYDAIIEGILQLGLGAGTKRKRFDEVTFMEQPPEAILAQRVIKRMRAEVIVDELYDSDDESSDSEAETATTEATTVRAPSPVKARQDDRARAAPLPVEDGKRVRRRKMRVAADDTSSDESSSSESESDADSDSSSGTDGDDSSDDEDDDARAEEADSSDSSDSSDSDSSDSDEEEEDGEDESDDSDSSDSSDSEDEQPAKATAAAKPKAKAEAHA